MFDGESARFAFVMLITFFAKATHRLPLIAFFGGGNFDTGRNQEADLRETSKLRPNKAPAKKKSRTRKEKTLSPGQRRPPSRGSCPA